MPLRCRLMLAKVDLPRIPVKNQPARPAAAIGRTRVQAEGCRRVRERGKRELPQRLAPDDLVLVKLRAHDSDFDLHETQSGLGREGYAFPLHARDQLLGVLVVGPRAGEHYAGEERELMAHVAHAVAASLFALQARAIEELLAAARAEAASSAACESVLREALRALDAGPSVSAEQYGGGLAAVVKQRSGPGPWDGPVRSQYCQRRRLADTDVLARFLDLPRHVAERPDTRACGAHRRFWEKGMPHGGVTYVRYCSNIRIWISGSNGIRRRRA